MSSYYDNDVATDSRGKDYLDIDSPIWSSINSYILENQDFFDNNKNSYINSMIYSNYTTNADIIPIIPLAITRYLTIIKSNIYNKSNFLETVNGDNSFSEYFKFNNLRLSLSRVLKDYNLHDVGFLSISGGADKLKFPVINPVDIRYNYEFTRVLVRLELVGDYRYRYKYYNTVKGSVKSIEFISGEWSGIDYAYLKGERQDLNNNGDMQILSTRTLKVIPVIPLFKTHNRIAQKSIYVYADLILNLLLGFGLGNVPNALLVKIWITNAKNSNSINMDDKLNALSDILDVLPLGESEKAGTLDMGKLDAFKNFFYIFEALLTHIAQLEGIPRSAMQIANPSRQSGASKQTDNRTSNIYRDWFIMELEEYEDKIFETINSLLGKNWQFKNIDKNMTITMSSSEILEEQILAVTNGFENFEVAIAKYHNISREDARKYLEDIKKSKEEFGDLLVGIAGMPMSNNNSSNITDKKDEGVYKGDKKNEEDK